MTLTSIEEQMMQGKICPYCKQKTEYVDSKIIYGKSYGFVYYCKKDAAWVGVHKGTNEALGRLANAELRDAKKQAHEYFDKIWQLKTMTRDEAYKWLSERIGTDPKYTHIGMFGVKTCKDVVYFSKQLLNDIRRSDLDWGDEPKTPYYEI